MADLVDIELYVHDTLELSVMVSETGLNKDVFFLPLSQIEVAPPTVGTKDKRLCEITLPEWLAIKKGLV